MPKIISNRAYLDNCTIGKWYYQGNFICYTIELPWLSNIPYKSCIPAGEYEIHRHHSEKYPNSFVFKNHDLGIGINRGDSLRFSCCAHIANYPKDVEGCIGPGIELQEDTWGVARSRDAMHVLQKLINPGLEEWKLLIT